MIKQLLFFYIDGITNYSQFFDDCWFYSGILMCIHDYIS
jgi:hypothetical protein